MWRFFKNHLDRFLHYRYRSRIAHVLKQAGRGEVRCDGLRLQKLSGRLEIQWQARDVHPWDRDDPAEKRAPAFVQQALADTESVISKLFETLPEVDVIDLKVIEPGSAGTIIEGTVERSAWSEKQPLRSVKMRLKGLGVHYRFS
jgi:hypothetical protein